MEISDFISIAASFFVAAAVFYMQRRQKRIDSAEKKHSDTRKQEILLSLELNMANSKLSYAVAMAIKRGKANGEVEDAILAYEAAKKKYYNFLNLQAIDHLQ